MALSVTTDHVVIAAVLDRFLAADPVGGTLLGTIRTSLEDSAWIAVDGDRFAVRSAAEWPVAVAGDWPVAARTELAARLTELPDLRGVSGLLLVVDALATQLGPERVASRMGQGLFRCDDLFPPVGVDGGAVRAAAAERALVHEWYAAFAVEVGHIAHPNAQVIDRLVDDGECWLWRDAEGAFVSMAARRPVVAGSARVGPVFTPAAARGHGYGSAVTAAATRDILDDGAVPVLFTDLANPTSNKIYQQIGYRPVDERLIVTFG
jgi:GNAT superfamily N-acetyltransferase